MYDRMQLCMYYSFFSILLNSRSNLFFRVQRLTQRNSIKKNRASSPSSFSAALSSRWPLSDVRCTWLPRNVNIGGRSRYLFLSGFARRFRSQLDKMSVSFPSARGACLRLCKKRYDGLATCVNYWHVGYARESGA